MPTPRPTPPVEHGTSPSWTAETSPEPPPRSLRGAGSAVGLCALTLLLSSVAVALSACDDEDESNVPQSQLNGVRVEVAFPNLRFDRPVDFQHTAKGKDRVFVVEQAGVIHVFDNDPKVKSTEVFLDIEKRVSRDNNEEGLLGLAFHPDYEKNRQFFVYYSAASPRRSILARYRTDPKDPNKALKGSEEILMEVAQPYGNHNGGQIQFGPDGFLYVGLGDGGDRNDPHGNGQNPKTLLGSILRIDVDKSSKGKSYGIPPDNPFAGNEKGYREEIYAYGLRNPWRFSWDAKTGKMWTGDVGQNEWEEIDIIEKGKNYGWNRMEGTHCFQPKSGCRRSGLELPIIDYPRDDGISVTGGFVYRGKKVGRLAGKYVYADFGSGKIWALEFNGKTAKTNYAVADTDLAVSSFGVDRHGELYLCSFDGKIYKFVQ